MYESWDKPALAVDPVKKAMALVEKSNDPKKHLEFLQKLIKCLKDSQQEIEAIMKLEELLFDDKIRAFYGPQLLSENASDESLLLDLIKTIERFEEVTTKKEIDTRRYRISAPPLKEVIRQVEEEVFLKSKVSNPLLNSIGAL